MQNPEERLWQAVCDAHRHCTAYRAGDDPNYRKALAAYVDGTGLSNSTKTKPSAVVLQFSAGGRR